MTSREYKYHRRRRWHRFMGKLSGYVDDYQLAQLKIQQLLHGRSRFNKSHYWLVQQSEIARQNIQQVIDNQ